MPSCASLLSAFLLATPLLSIILGAQAPPRDRAPAQEKGTAAILGQVVVAGEGGPAARVQVVALRFDPSAGGRPPRYQATSDAHGRFQIGELPAGRYSVFPIIPRDRPQYAAELSERYSWIDLADGEVAENVTLTIQRTGVIAGRVVNEFGEPVAWARVSALMIRPGSVEPVETGFGRETDDLGRFRLFGLVPSDYHVKVNPADSARPFEEDDPVRYVTAYYPGVAAAHEAQALNLAGGQEIEGIEIPIRRGRTFRVTGVVLSAGGSATRALVNYRLGSDGMGSSTQPDGTFVISGLAAGEYTFHASTMMGPDYGEEPEASAAVTLQVESDIEGLTLVMRRGARVSGRVTIEGDDQPTPNLASLRVTALPRAGSMSFGPPPAASVRPDGSFTLTRLLDATILRVAEVQPPWHLKSVRYKGTDVTDVPTEFADNPDPKQLEVVVANRGARLQIRVSDGRGAPVTDGFVLLFASDPKKRLPGSTMTRIAGIGRDGLAAFEGLRPGTYLATAFDSEGPMAGRRDEDEMFEHLVPLATGVELLENDAREMSLTLIAGPQ